MQAPATVAMQAPAKIFTPQHDERLIKGAELTSLTAATLNALARAEQRQQLQSKQPQQVPSPAKVAEPAGNGSSIWEQFWSGLVRQTAPVAMLAAVAASAEAGAAAAGGNGGMHDGVNDSGKFGGTSRCLWHSPPSLAYPLARQWHA